MITLDQIVQTSREVAATRSRTAKIRRLAQCLAATEPAEVATAAACLTGEPPQGRIGIGFATLRDVLATTPAAEASTLTLADVDATLATIAATSGAGSTRRRRALLTELFQRATREEQEFLARLLLGELRQGALDGLMADAITHAFNVPAPQVRRAIMVTGSLAETAKTAAAEGEAGLARFGLRVFQPVHPMLAQTAETPGEALERLGTAAFDYKLDGARIQVHRSGDAVRVYTRALNEVTDALPEIVSTALTIPAREFILDGEAIALRADGTPWPFQTTMRRFGRKTDVDGVRDTIPLQSFFFDVLAVEGQTLIDAPASERFAVQEAMLPARLRVPRIRTADPGEADAFLARAKADGHEGLIAKSLESPYEAGSRGGGWLKIKFVRTLDLVVLAAEWGHGRRQGWLSNLHLGARDGAGGFVMLGKTFKGLTDAMLEWQTRELLAREVSRDEWTVRVRPELVVEIAFNDVQTSPRYPGGLALRFARVKAYRPDKTPAEADHIDTVRASWRQQVADEARSV